MVMCSRCHKRPAVVFITKVEGNEQKNEGLCIPCAKELGIKPVDDLIKKFGLSDEDIEAMSEQMMQLTQPTGEDGEDGDFEGGNMPTFPPMFMGFGPQEKGEKVTEKDGSRPKGPVKHKFLDTYCDNLTAKARDGRIDRVIGRDEEIYRTIQILSRRQKNNPCLIGEAGVGKTAIAEGIALRVARGDVPANLRDREIYLLDLTALVAGTQFRGQFESRIKSLIGEVKSAGNVILFIDEIHNITAAGDAEGAMNAANILKPALSRGEIQVIGATTFAEYRKYIEKDQALERRFQTVRVEEPSIADATDVLRGVKEYYENYHHVKIPDSILARIVTLSERYISDRFLPDKAIDLLDEAAACCALRHTELADYQVAMKRISELTAAEEADADKTDLTDEDYAAAAERRSELMRLEEKTNALRPAVEAIEVTGDDVSRVIELWTGIPADKIEQSEYDKLAALEGELKKHIIGQDEAVRAVAEAVKRSRVGLTARRRPASFIFVGPTGVGKTELVKVLAGELFDGVDPLIRLDMSEYMEKHTVARLIGSPPGYVGYDEAGQLTEKVRRRPYSVVLFDEIEKAHPDVLNILLQILDEGRVTDAQGRTVNFENTVICMTSNAGSSDKTGTAGFGRTAEDMSRERTLKALSDFLRPEFLGRVDEVIVFRPLSAESLRRIAALMLDEMRQPLADKGIELAYTDEALAAIAEKGGNGRSGARELRRIIRREVEDPLADRIIEAGSASRIKKVTIDAEKGELVLR